MLSLADKITSSVMSCQIALNQLEDIKQTKYYSGVLKNKLNNIIPELINREKAFYDAFFEVNSESTDAVYTVNANFIEKVSKIAIYDMENISFIIDAYYKDKKSIEGIVNKILR